MPEGPKSSKMPLDELAGIENAAGVEGVLHGAMEGAHLFGNGEGPPTFFGQADAVFTGDRAAPGDDLREQLVQRLLAAAFGAGLVEIHHDVGVDVAVARVAEAGD